MARERSNQKATWLRINGDGWFVEVSKQPREGFEKKEVINPKTGKKSIKYFKYYSSTDDGYLEIFRIVEKELGGKSLKYLQVGVKIPETNSLDVIEIPLFYSSGRLNDYVKSLLNNISGLDFSKKIRISASRKKNDRGFTNKVLFVNYADTGELVRWGIDVKKVPKWEQEKSITGDVTWSSKKQDEFYYKLLLEQIDRFVKYKKSGQGEKYVKEQENTEETVKEKHVDDFQTVDDVPDTADKYNSDDFDDLPF